MSNHVIMTCPHESSAAIVTMFFWQRCFLQKQAAPLCCSHHFRVAGGAVSVTRSPFAAKKQLVAVRVRTQNRSWVVG